MKRISEERKTEAMKILLKNKFTFGEVRVIFRIRGRKWFKKLCERADYVELYETLERIKKKEGWK